MLRTCSGVASTPAPAHPLRETDHPASPHLSDRAKNKRELNAKQTGATLGDESVGNTSSWAKNLKKQAKLKAERKKLEDKRREEEEEMDRLGAEDKYTESEFRQFTMSHGRFLPGEDGRPGELRWW